MLYMVPTKRGVGVELWGTRGDLEYFYDAITDFFLGEDKLNFPGAENRLKLLSSFSYEVRKAYEGARLKRSFGHFSMEDQACLGTQFSWVHALFSLAGLKYAMNYQGAARQESSPQSATTHICVCYVTYKERVIQLILII